MKPTAVFNRTRTPSVGCGLVMMVDKKILDTSRANDNYKASEMIRSKFKKKSRSVCCFNKTAKEITNVGLKERLLRGPAVSNSLSSFNNGIKFNKGFD